jgi:hypothetical protein
LFPERKLFSIIKLEEIDATSNGVLTVPARSSRPRNAKPRIAALKRKAAGQQVLKR